MSWLWDVDFDSLTRVSEVGGVRAYDMALRLQYENVPVDHVETDLTAALKHFLHANKSKSKRIFCTYTAMLALRKELAHSAIVEKVL